MFVCLSASLSPVAVVLSIFMKTFAFFVPLSYTASYLKKYAYIFSIGIHLCILVNTYCMHIMYISNVSIYVERGLDGDIVVSSNSNRVITFTFRLTPSEKVWTPLASQLWVKLSHNCSPRMTGIKYPTKVNMPLKPRNQSICVNELLSVYSVLVYYCIYWR